MKFALTEDQVLFTEAVRELLADQCTPTALRATWQADAGTISRLWASLAEMGVLGLLAPESYGGMGLGALDVHPMLVEAGRVAMPDPIVDTAAVAVPVLASCQSESLASIIAGDTSVAVAFADDPVVRADTDLLLVEYGKRWHLVESASLVGVAEQSVDGARAMASLKALPDESSALNLDPTIAATIRARAIVAQSAVLIGLARHLLDETVAYVQAREQFGKPVGAQQAIKHKMSDTLLAVEYAGPLVARAAYSIDHGDPDAGLHASMAKANAADAAKLAARHALQSHGAIAYTVEYDLHMWMKRVWALASHWGTADHHRAIVRTHLGL